jgi:hypothetical protein
MHATRRVNYLLPEQEMGSQRIYIAEQTISRNRTTTTTPFRFSAQNPTRWQPLEEKCAARRKMPHLPSHHGCTIPKMIMQSPFCDVQQNFSHFCFGRTARDLRSKDRS